MRGISDAGVPAVRRPRQSRLPPRASGFAQATGATLLPEYVVLDLHGVRTVLCHGDILCTDDTEYQAYRARMRDPATQARLLRLPYFVRRMIAGWMRGSSRDVKALKPESIMDVTPAAVADAFRQHGAQRMIHGHTHRPGAPRARRGRHGARAHRAVGLARSRALSRGRRRRVRTIGKSRRAKPPRQTPLSATIASERGIATSQAKREGDIMKAGKTGFWLGAMLAALLWTGTARAQVEIEYWQYTFAQRVQAIDELIKRFEAANPGIKVKHTHVPYDDFRVKIAAAIPAGQGPDVVQLFYGWLQDYLKAGTAATAARQRLQRRRDRDGVLPDRPADEGRRQSTMRCRPPCGRWRCSGTRTCSRKPGSTPTSRRQRWTSSSTTPAKLTKRSPNGDLLQEGLTIDMGGQDHHWLREVLIRQFGGVPYSPDRKTVAYNTDAGVAATQWYIDLVGKQKVGQIGFLTDGVTAFRSGKAGMTIDGSFRLGALDNQKGLEYGVAELPARGGVKSNFASYWVNGITTKATGAKLDASVKFLKFLTTPEAMELWLATVGELPARKSVAEKDANRNHAEVRPVHSRPDLFLRDRLRQRERPAQGADGHGRQGGAQERADQGSGRPGRGRRAEAARRLLQEVGGIGAARRRRVACRGTNCPSNSAAKPRDDPAVCSDLTARRRSARSGRGDSSRCRSSSTSTIRFYPTVEAFRASFTNWNIVGRMEYIGLANYARLVQDPTFWKVIGNTFVYLGLGVSISMLLSFVIAYYLDRVRFGHGLLRALYFIPHLTTAVAMAWVWRWFYQPPPVGAFNVWLVDWASARCRSCAPPRRRCRPCWRRRSGPASGSRS